MESYIRTNADHMALIRNRHFVLRDTLEDVIFISHYLSDSVVEDMAQAQLKMGAGAGGRRQRRQRIDCPCIICDEKCGMDTIACDDCACWAHRTCVPLTPTQFQELSKKGRPFRCRRCVCDRSNGKFNYFRSLKRYGISFLCLKFVKTFNVSSLRPTSLSNDRVGGLQVQAVVYCKGL